MAHDAEPAVIYEDERVLVINKPAGLITHSDGKTDEKSVSSWFISRCPEAAGVGESITLQDGTVIEKPGIVHRLDRETSGVLILVKDQQTFSFIKEQFRSRAVQKIYHAFVYGVLGSEYGVIDRPIGKSKKDFKLWSAQRGARGTLREAVTEYTVLVRGENMSFLELRPRTGRTHQLRVHLKAIHHPIVCDALYAPKEQCPEPFTRLALHASKLELDIASGDHRSFEAPLPEEFLRVKETL